MTLEEAIHTYLAAQTDVTDIVSTRLYQGKRPQGSDLPALTYEVTSDSDVDYQDGATGLSEAYVSFDCWAADPGGAKTLRDALRGVLHGKPCGTLGTVTVDAIRLQESNLVEYPPQDKSDAGKYSYECSYVFWYRTTVPSFS